MNRNWDIMRNAANGADPWGSTKKWSDRGRASRETNPPGSEMTPKPEDAERLSRASRAFEGAADYGYGAFGQHERAPADDAGFFDERGRYAEQHGGEHEPSLWDRVKGAFSGRGPKNWTRSDARIHEDVCERLAAHPYVDASEIEVAVEGGEVTLSGTAPDRRMKRLAEDLVEGVRGVRDVHNRVRVPR